MISKDAVEDMRRAVEGSCSCTGCCSAAHAELRAIFEIALAALDYGDSVHVRNSNCAAGDHDQCSAREALQKLEALVGGPRSTDE